MFEYHGWAVLQPDTGDFDFRLVQEIAVVVRRRLDSRADDIYMAGVADDNGLTTVWFHGQRNHPRPGPLNFLRFIGEQAPGAYGVLFVRDDDDDERHLNEYRVLRLARGKVQEFSDPFLSPCVPTIEDPEKRFTPPE